MALVNFDSLVRSSYLSEGTSGRTARIAPSTFSIDVSLSAVRPHLSIVSGVPIQAHLGTARPLECLPESLLKTLGRSLARRDHRFVVCARRMDIDEYVSVCRLLERADAQQFPVRLFGSYVQHNTADLRNIYQDPALGTFYVADARLVPISPNRSSSLGRNQ